MINQTWDDFLTKEFEKDYFKQLSTFLKQQYAEKVIYPSKKDVFSAFYYTDLDAVKVVILGQDPYHEPNQAMGMCFSVQPQTPLPPSLINIYKEIENDLNVKKNYADGSLLNWAKQGVLLINTVMTVEQGKANSHRGQGWEQFTDNVIKLLNKTNRPIAYLLWGANAKSKKELITSPQQLVLTAAHPSPLSAYNGFFGCKHFSQANKYLIDNGLTPIDWSK